MMTSLLAGSPALTRRAGLIAAGLTALLALLMASGPLKADDAKDPLVAKVNGVEIHQSDLDAAEKEAGQIPPMPPEAKRDYLVQFMADVILVSKAAEEKKIGDTAEFKRQMEFDRRKLLMSDLLQSVGKAALTEDAMHKVYEEAVKQIGQQEEVHARHILIRATQGDEKASAAAKGKIEAIIARLNKGEDFVKVAKETTEDPSGKANGGDLGYFTKDQMVPAFSKVAFELKKGEISGPVQTQFGWHVIKLEDKRVKPPPKFSDVKAQIENYVERKAQADLVQKLRSEAKVEKFYKTADESKKDEPAKKAEPAKDAPAAPAKK